MAGRISEQQQVFAKTYAMSGSKPLAAREAQYSHPDTQGYRVANKPLVIAEIVKEQNRILYGELLPAAVACLGEIIRDKHAPTGARVNAAKIVMDRTIGASDTFAKEPHEMTAEELARAIAELEKAAAGKAKEVTGEVLEDEAPDPFA